MRPLTVLTLSRRDSAKIASMIVPTTMGAMALLHFELGVVDRLTANRTTTSEVGVVHQHPNLLNRGKVANDLLKTAAGAL